MVRQTIDRGLPSLVVCASLVEKLANQAALCRTCEVLGVNQLVLPKPDDSWEFRKIAVSAQQWQTLTYCSPQGLKTWLSRQLGYTCVALTAGAQARSVVTYSFAANTVLILGRELTGIPADIEELCDVALTIPQYGQIDSLNVQTAGAIAIYEYNRQWR